MQKNHCSLLKKEGEEELKSEVFTFNPLPRILK